MARYFLELSYKGTNYKGFQVQENAHTIQGEVEKAFEILLRQKVPLTGSSRTDAGVHAVQNYFHFDYDGEFLQQSLYNLNAILPEDIALRRIYKMHKEAHARFDAVSRRYRYTICLVKDPFTNDLVYYYPYSMDTEKLQVYADEILLHNDFTSFSKRNTQVKTFLCTISESRWAMEDGRLVYYVQGNRFLRGMVRALVATMLLAARNNLPVSEFKGIIDSRDCTKASFAAPAQGLFLLSVNYPSGYLSLK